MMLAPTVTTFIDVEDSFRIKNEIDLLYIDTNVCNNNILFSKG